MKSNRKKFLGIIAGAWATILWTDSACNKPQAEGGPNFGANGYGFGSGDIGILNYLYVLEQLSAAFYQKVTSQMFASASADELSLYGDIYLQELSHREFLKSALGSNGLPDLQLDFSSVNFASRASVIANALLIEDTGIRSANRAAASIQSSAFLTIAAEILSVESRHATWIHERNQSNSFSGANLTDGNSLEKSTLPQDALITLSPFIKTKLDTGSLVLS